MGSLNTENLSPFGRVAVKLDGDFSELDRLSGQLQRLEIDTESGFDRAVKILNQFTQHGQSIAEGIQEFSKTLQTARENAEKAAAIVSERAQWVQKRKEEQDQIQEKLSQLGQRAKQLVASLSEGEKDQIPARLQTLDSQLSTLIEEAQAIRTEANQSNLKALERGAESLVGTLQSAKRKLGSVPRLPA